MATHSVSLQVAHAVPIGSVDITLPVRKDGKLLGTLTISQGGVDWKKAHAQKHVSFSWTQFAELMASA
jgi:hypothetical protein